MYLTFTNIPTFVQMYLLVPTFGRAYFYLLDIKLSKVSVSTKQLVSHFTKLTLTPNSKAITHLNKHEIITSNPTTCLAKTGNAHLFPIMQT